MSAKITYNSKTTELAGGKIATLSCSGKKMKSDIVITVPKAESGTDSAIPTEVSTEAEMTALLESGEVGGVYKYTGTTGTYENGALYVLEAEPSSYTVTFNLISTGKDADMGWKVQYEDGTWSDDLYSAQNGAVFEKVTNIELWSDDDSFAVNHYGVDSGTLYSGESHFFPVTANTVLSYERYGKLNGTSYGWVWTFTAG